MPEKAFGTLALLRSSSVHSCPARQSCRSSSVEMSILYWRREADAGISPSSDDAKISRPWDLQARLQGARSSRIPFSRRI